MHRQAQVATRSKVSVPSASKLVTKLFDTSMEEVPSTTGHIERERTLTDARYKEAHQYLSRSEQCMCMCACVQV
jgi:hypothetical protein